MPRAGGGGSPRGVGRRGRVGSRLGLVESSGVWLDRAVLAWAAGLPSGEAARSFGFGFGVVAWLT